MNPYQSQKPNSAFINNTMQTHMDRAWRPVNGAANQAENEAAFSAQNVRTPRSAKSPVFEGDFLWFVPKSQPRPIPETTTNLHAIDSKAYSRTLRN